MSILGRGNWNVDFLGRGTASGIKARLEAVNYEHPGLEAVNDRNVKILAFLFWPFFEITLTTDFRERCKKVTTPLPKMALHSGKQPSGLRAPSQTARDFFPLFFGA